MTRKPAKSEAAFAQAGEVLVGGVNSPVRAFKAVGGVPRFIVSARGSKITDIDGNEYVDYVCGYGPGILGHAHPKVVQAVTAAARRGFCYGAPTEAETELAEMVVDAFPSIQKVRFVSSGTEAVMSAIRLARGATGRNGIVKCVGCYHGHADALLVAAGSGATTLGVPSSPGVPEGAADDTLLVPYNDLAAAGEVFDRHGSQIAAMLVEPVAGNMGVVPPAEGYLPGLRSLCDAAGTLLIFDEVMTGFRIAHAGAQELYGVRADLTTLGKVIGGGMPVGAFGGGPELMANLSPEGPVYQAGTLSGNPLAMAAGIATLKILRDGRIYAHLEARSATLATGLVQAASDAGLKDKVCFNRIGSMLCCFFARPPVTDYASAVASNTKAYAAFFHAMLDAGVNLAPSQFEAMFVSMAHTDADIARTAEAASPAFAAAAKLMDERPQSR